MDRIVVGCMRFGEFSRERMNSFIHESEEIGLTHFDHADIYAGGESERIFGDAFSSDGTLKRENFFIQSKCGIRKGFYDLSKEYILNSVDGILSRLKTDYLDCLLLHRPDALMDCEEIACAFDVLHDSGKVKSFGVSNFNSLQIELLKKHVRHPVEKNQLQFSICAAGMVSQGLEANMISKGSVLHDSSILDYCRLNEITIQAWSPFQKPEWKGTFLGDEEYSELNKVLENLSEKYSSTPTQLASAWILRHPAKMQLIAGTTKIERLREIELAEKIELSREDWYAIYLSAGNILP